jgi:hypothetical protein
MTTVRTEWPERCARVELPASAFADFRKAIPSDAVIVEANPITNGADDTGELEVFVSHRLLKKVEPGYMPPTTIPHFSMSVGERRIPNTKTGGWESEPVPGSRLVHFLGWGDQHDSGLVVRDDRPPAKFAADRIDVIERQLRENGLDAALIAEALRILSSHIRGGHSRENC